jgi:hypothetical protein
MRTKSRQPKEPPPADFHEVKRRFIRQNRELAKNNSSQSLRIRSLELEVSKLLGDNLELREQVLALQNELYNARVQAVTSAASRVKAELKAKLAELTGLVDGIEDQDTGIRRELPEKKSILSPSRQQYRERQPLAELMVDSQMPTISEDKMFPRRSLDADDPRQIRLSDQSATTGSPDIGPPPVAHFEDLPRFDSQEYEAVVEDDGGPPQSEDEFLPSINLETRRKRKDPSHPRGESRRSSILAHSPDKPESDAPSTMLRTGAKRKLADREPEKAGRPPAQEDFTFSRRASSVHFALQDESSSGKQELEVSTDSEPPVSPMKPARRVLGDKSTNMSPVKASFKTSDDLKNPAPAKPTASRERPPSRTSRRISSNPSIPVAPSRDDNASPFDIAPPRSFSTEPLPKTPASFDVFSPPASEHAEGQQGRDTPPPADLSSISNTTEGGQRPSRRARSAVNYAEPSLIAKMRRPDKKMVDAVNGLQDPRKVMITSSASAEGKKRTATGTIKIKEEPSDDEPSAFKNLPHTSSLSRESMGSPLRHRTTDDHGSPRVSPRESPSRPSPSGLLSDGDLTSRPQGISTLIANSRKRREALDRRISPPLATDNQINAAAKKMEEMDLYDFKDSSSPASGYDGSETAGSARAIASHRRHSSASKISSDANGGGSTTERTSSTSAATAIGHGARMSTRRRSMMV